MAGVTRCWNGIPRASAGAQRAAGGEARTVPSVHEQPRRGRNRAAEPTRVAQGATGRCTLPCAAMSELIRYALQIRWPCCISTMRANAVSQRRDRCLHAALARAERKPAPRCAGRPGRFSGGLRPRGDQPGPRRRARPRERGGELLARIVEAEVPVVSACAATALREMGALLLLAGLANGASGDFKIASTKSRSSSHLPCLRSSSRARGSRAAQLGARPRSPRSKTRPVRSVRASSIASAAGRLEAEALAAATQLAKLSAARTAHQAEAARPDASTASADAQGGSRGMERSVSALSAALGVALAIARCQSGARGSRARPLVSAGRKAVAERRAQAPAPAQRRT